METQRTGTFSTQSIALIPVGIALNLSIGTIVHTLKLPVYVDAVGTIIITLIAGWRAGVLTGVLSFLLGGLLTNPVLPYFAGTQAMIAIFIHAVGQAGWFKRVPKVVASGIGLGVVAAIVSAPVIVYLFGGITGSGASLVVAYLLASGKGIIQSVILSGIAAEPVDKTIQCLLAYWLLRGMPKSLLSGFTGGSLVQNDFVASKIEKIENE